MTLRKGSEAGEGDEDHGGSQGQRVKSTVSPCDYGTQLLQHLPAERPDGVRMKNRRAWKQVQGMGRGRGEAEEERSRRGPGEGPGGDPSEPPRCPRVCLEEDGQTDEQTD